MRRSRRFPAMGSKIELSVEWTGDPSAVDDVLANAERRVAELEERWSRFRSDSELSQLNQANGAPTVVSALTFELLVAARTAWESTEGCFDPSVLPALEAAGYDRPFADGLDRDDRPGSASAAGRFGDIDLDPVARLVTLGPQCRLDLGGIAKGATADLVSAELLAAGALGACVSIGGDVRVRTKPGAAPWPVGTSVAPERAPIELLDGAVCTSSGSRRTWRAGDRRVHHLIDPTTGLSFAGPVREAAVLAGNALTAEVLTKVVFARSGPDAAELLAAHGAAAVAVLDGGDAVTIGAWPSGPAPRTLEEAA